MNFTVEDTTDFTICAKVSSHIENRAVTVVCQGMVGFMFRNISHVALEGLTFTSCGKGEVTYSPVYSDYMTTYGVSIYLGQDIKISNCSIQDTAGTAMGVLYSSLNLRGSNSFTNNCRGCFDRNHTSLYTLGGGIYTKTSTLIVSGESFFGGNSAEIGGGIYAENSILDFTGTHTFSDNSAQMFGGGIAAVKCILDFSGNHTFNDSSAHLFGGGISALHTALNFKGNSIFTANAAEFGGGIGAMNGSLAFDGDSTFQENSAVNNGGGIFAGYSILAFSENGIFTGNSAQQYGGGILCKLDTAHGSGIFWACA